MLLGYENQNNNNYRWKLCSSRLQVWAGDCDPLGYACACSSDLLGYWLCRWLWSSGLWLCRWLWSSGLCCAGDGDLLGYAVQKMVIFWVMIGHVVVICWVIGCAGDCDLLGYVVQEMVIFWVMLCRRLWSSGLCCEGDCDLLGYAWACGSDLLGYWLCRQLWSSGLWCEDDCDLLGYAVQVTVIFWVMLCRWLWSPMLQLCVDNCDCLGYDCMSSWPWSCHLWLQCWLPVLWRHILPSYLQGKNRPSQEISTLVGEGPSLAAMRKRLKGPGQDDGN